MPLLGQGVLTIWNGIADSAEAEFVAWHVREHIPERVGLPGFLRGRRYVADQGHPKYFNFYETLDEAVLTSDAYRRRLDAPTPWTRSVVKHFTDTSRTICRVVVSQGAGEGGWIETIRILGTKDHAAFTNGAAIMLARCLEAPGIVATHLLEGQTAASQGTSAEKAMRAGRDEIVAAVILIEAVDRESLLALRTGACSDQTLEDLGTEGRVARGLYTYQFGLGHDQAAR